MSPSIFISFASADRSYAERIIAFLEANNFGCWVAFRDVGIGDNYQEAITRALRSATVLIVLISRNANRSNEIQKELSLASRYKLVVIPLRVEEVEPNDALAYELTTRQWIELYRDWKSGSERLLSQLAGIVKPSPQGAAAPTPVASRGGGSATLGMPAGTPSQAFSEAVAAARARRPVTGETFVPPRRPAAGQPVVLHETAPAQRIPVSPAARSADTQLGAANRQLANRVIAMAKFLLVAGVFGTLLYKSLQQGQPSIVELIFWTILLVGCARLLEIVLRACFGRLGAGARRA